MIREHFTKLSGEYRLTLETSVRYLKGVGPRWEEKLARLGVRTVGDLVLAGPRAWEDRRLFGDFKPASNEPRRAFVCEIESVHESVNPYKNLCFFRATVKTQDRYLPGLSLLWIRRRSRFDVFGRLRQEIAPGRKILAFGRLDHSSVPKHQGVGLYVEEYDALDDGLLPKASPHWGGWIPVYPATEGVSQRKLRELRWGALKVWREHASCWSWPKDWAEHLPEGVTDLKNAREEIHFPANLETRRRARMTLAFWQIFLLALAMELRRRRMVDASKKHTYLPGPSSPLFDKLLSHRGLVLTQGQQKAIDDIIRDMNRPAPMNRLLQGEVGSGKTLVALAAICQAVASGHQAAFIAPTEILVFQHLINLKEFLEPLGVSIASLTSDTQAKERKEILEGLAAGHIKLVVGTHALLDPDVRFQSLALTVIDEQHRFGVNQRWTLRNKASSPDCLVLSATPIPRTLALALYGDLDISTMEELPSGHPIAKAILVKTEQEAWERLRAALGEGQQAYVVVPAIEESSELYNLEKERGELVKLFPKHRIGTIHGRMPSKEKEEALKNFAQGRSDVLLATTVIEVGIDVARAGAMIVLGAERFGLATLHQLRGRVGRGAKEGLCVLVFSSAQHQAAAGTPAVERPKDLLFQEPAAAGEADLSLDRLKRFCECRSGFEIGELDLELRGPGELLGRVQHGDFDLGYFDWKQDKDLIPAARALVHRQVQGDAALDPQLRRAVEERFGRDFLQSDIS
ncbi:MAG: ATP-dependent DNA helicase RecG [Elusimicrobia bacterium]|nr:ATP-dependent DNA helicase RecG [Elusimicrobiota bacterium]